MWNNEIINNIKLEFSSYFLNRRGLKTNKRIVVFESDDWGSIRMTNKATYNALLQKGIPVDKSVYCKYDTLESVDDVNRLAELFGKYKNYNDENPKLTMNYVTANPDFDKIGESDKEEYFFEPFTDTYKKLASSIDVFDIVKTGIVENLFMPQFHGRDHVNVPLWLNLLKTNEAFKIGFEYGIWGLSKDVFPKMRKSIQATYDSVDLNYTKSSIVEGLSLFKEQFGFGSNSFIANNYVWSNDLNETLKNYGVAHFQTMKYQLHPPCFDENKFKIRRYFGSINEFGQTYAPRNCAFEPTEFGHDHLYTLKQISRAFFYKKPAIISTHRINFVGGLDERKRDVNLSELDLLIKKIVLFWPDVTFLSSDQLNGLILEQSNNDF
jgi:hypothetical protein